MATSKALGKTTERAITAILLVLTLALAGLSGVIGTTSAAYADAVIGEVILDPGAFVSPVREFDSYSELADYVKGLKDREFIIEMRSDWDATERLVIPANAHASLNMQGHMIDRGLTQSTQSAGWKSDGEVIVVKSGAVLTVNGGSASNTHEANIYESTDPNASPVSSTVQGALITGGASTNGAGGIHMQTGTTITLNNVTIAGCRSQRGSAARVGSVLSGYGGGMYLCGGDSTVNMNNATITGCYASEDGGGIYLDDSKASKINLVNSHIDANCARDDSGGIDASSKGTRITGDAVLDDDGVLSGSTVSRNKSGARGGGILVWNSNIGISHLALENNQGGNGGGINSTQDKALLDNLIIRGNQADKGGGIYFTPGSSDANNYAGNTEINSCTITGNTAQTSGGGVYCDEHSAANAKRKRMLSGVTVIKQNICNANSDYRDLCIASKEWSAKDESFNLSEGSEVWIAWTKEGNQSRKSANKDENCAQYLYSNQADYCFRYNVAERCINRITIEEAPSIPQALTIPAANANDASGEGKSGSNTVAGKVGTVGAGGGSGSDYNLIRGFASHGGLDEMSSFYYSDGLFYSSPYTYNEHLATVSLTFAYCGGYMDNFAEQDANGNTYYNKHWGAKQFLADIGCPDQNIYVSDSMIVKPGTDSVGVTIGSKELTRADGTKTGDILIPVAVRGFGYEAEWVSNVTIGYAAEMGWQKEAKGFSEAATYVFKEIEYYVEKYNLFDAYKAGKVKFWITGYSRAGATANLTAKRLVDAIANDGCGSQVFCYPCEAPKGGTDDAETAGHNYNCIHNLINKVDIVPYVAPGQMGFKRYGVDHYIPGTPAGEVKSTVKSVTQGGAGGPSKVSTDADNSPTLTKTSAYNQQRSLMLKQLTALNPNMTFNDSFQPQALDFISTSGIVHIYDEGDNEGNHVEDFVEDLIWLLVQKSNISRDMYARDNYTLNGTTYPSIQTVARNLMLIAKSGSGLTGIMDSAGNIKSDLPKVSFYTFWPFGDLGTATPKSIDYSAVSLYLHVVGEWGDLPDDDKEAWTRNLWNTFVKSGALDKLNADEKEKLQTAFPTVLNVALTLVDSDYNYKPKTNENNQWAKGSNETMMYIPTFAEHFSYIVQNHDQNLNLAWARSYDSWYQDEIDYFKLAQPGSVDAPQGFGTAYGEPQELVAGEENKLAGDQRIILDNEAIVGEAVYYDLYDVTAGNEKLATNRLYRGGIDLARNGAAEKTYEIVAYDMSYGVKSNTVTYRVTLTDTMHKVIVRDLAASSMSGASADATAADDAQAAEPGASANAGGANTSGRGTAASRGHNSDGGAGLMAGTVSGSLLQPAGDGDGDDYAAYRSREYSFIEGQKAFAQADVPSTRYFKTWEVQVLDKNGTKVADVSDTLITYGKTSNPASFTMPKEEDGTDYPQGYQLLFTAQYGTRISEMTAVVEAPVKGQVLPESMTVTFDNGKSDTYRVSWMFQRGEGQDARWVPAPRDVMADTVYHAVVEVDQDWENDILFTADASVVLGGQSDKVQKWSFERDSTTNSILFWITFEKTEGDDPAPEPQPEPSLTFTVSARDLYDGELMPGISETFVSRPGDSVTLVAPNIENRIFMGWDFGGFDPRAVPDDASNRTVTFELPEDSLNGSEIVAQYVPVVSKVEANLYDEDGNLFAPVAGGSGPESCEVFFAIGDDEFEVNPDTLSVMWSPEVPEDGRFAPLTSYLGSVKVAFTNEEDQSPTISVRRKGTEGAFQDIGITSVLADDFKALFNGDDQDVAVDFAEQTASKMFPATTYTLSKVKQPDSISGVPYADGASAGQVRNMLPSTTQILTAHGIELDADIEWGEIAGPAHEGDEWSAAIWTATGTVKLPDAVTNPDNVDVDVSMTVAVEDAGTALTPTTTLESGEYLYNQETKLDTHDESGATYYTTDGSDPRDSQTRQVYDGKPIYIDRRAANQVEEKSGKKMFVIKAYTAGIGKRDSDVATYQYAFSDIPIPQGAVLDYAEDEEGQGIEQIGVEWGVFYTLEPVGEPLAWLDSLDNAVAIDPGVYQVKAKLDPNSGADRWETNDEQGWSGEDQIVEFVITGKKTSYVTIGVQAKPLEGGSATGSGTYEADESGEADVTVKATANSGYAFVNWTESDSESIGVVSDEAEYAFRTSYGRSLTANFARILTVRWLDGDGSVLHEATYNEGDDEPTYPETGKTPTKEPTVAYTYEFSDWDAGRTSDTVKTYKPVFTATLNKYSVTFVDEDGTVLKEPMRYDYDTLPKDMDIPQDPTKPATTQYSYAFDKWVNADTGEGLEPVAGDTTYKATYTETLIKYWSRLAGKTRYQTAAEIIGASFEESDVAVVATGASFPDALAASALAGAYDAPVILTDGTKATLGADAKATLERLGVKKAFLMGGKKAISEGVEQQIAALNGGVEVVRIAGNTRYATSVAALEAVLAAPDAKPFDTVVLATGENYPDTLSIGPWSYATNTPILLVKGDSLNADVAAAIREHASKIVIVGGTGVVSEALEAQAAEIVGAENVTRLAGNTRYITSQVIAEWAIEQGMTLAHPAVASAQNFPDALAGAALCGKNNSVMMLVDEIDDPCAEMLSERKGDLEFGYFLGGAKAVPDDLADAIVDATDALWWVAEP